MNAEQLENEFVDDAIPPGARAVLEKLDAELAMLKEAVSKIDPNSKDPGDLWAIPIYQKIIKRREKLAQCLSGS